MYSMFSTPLTFCSIGSPTVLTSVVALAPGYRVVTWTVGGTTFGYCEVGRLTSATSPMTTKNSARTLARTGRSMKKREIMGVTPPPSLRRIHRGWFCRIRRGRLRRLGCSGRRAVLIGGRLVELRLLWRDLGAWERALDAFRHHPLAGIEPGLDDPVRALALARLDDFALDDIVLAHHQQIAALLARPKRHIRHKNRLGQFLDRRPDPDEQAWQQPSLLVVEDRTGLERAGRGVDLGRRVIHVAQVRKAIFTLEPDFDWDGGEIRRPKLDTGFRVVPFDTKNLGLAYREIDVERIELEDRRELGRRADADERALVDKVPRDDSVERRVHRRVVQVDLGCLDGGFGVQLLRGRLVRFRLPFLHRGLAGEILFPQLRLAPVFGLVVSEGRLIGRERRIRLVELSLVLVAFDAKELVACLDRGAVGIVDVRKESLHARDEIDRIEGRSVAGQVEIERHRLLQRLRNRDLWRRRRRVGVLRTIAGRQRDRGGDEASGAKDAPAHFGRGTKFLRQHASADPRNEQNNS